MPGAHRAEGGGAAELVRRTVRAAHGDVLVKALLSPHAGAGGLRAGAGVHCAEPDSCRPITPTITSEIDTSLSVETTSSRKTMP